jgi:single-strand DNA-binding protein
MSVNKVILVGRLGGDPVDAPNNGPVTFSLATSQHWRDKASGEQRERTFWHSVVIFEDRLRQFAIEKLKKGCMAWVEGQLSTRKFEHKGVTRYTTEVILRGFRCGLQLVESDDIGAGGGFRPVAGGGRRAPSLADHGYDEPGAREDDEAAEEYAHTGRQGSRANYQAPIEDNRGKSGPGEYFQGDPNARPRTTYDTATTSFDKDREEEIPF